MDEQRDEQATVRPMTNPHNRRLVIGLSMIFGLMLVSSLLETFNKERSPHKPAPATATHPASTARPVMAPVAAPATAQARPAAAVPSGSATDVQVYADPLTGCQYLVTVTGITPRLTPAGTPYCLIHGNTASRSVSGRR